MTCKHTDLTTLAIQDWYLALVQYSLEIVH